MVIAPPFRNILKQKNLLIFFNNMCMKFEVLKLNIFFKKKITEKRLIFARLTIFPPLIHCHNESILSRICFDMFIV